MEGAMTGSEMILARYYAKEAVKRELRSRGIKLLHVEAGEITRAANQYIDDHPEIIAFATEQYRSLVASGRLRPPRKETCAALERFAQRKKR
jgi:hypothetical protein